MLAVAITLLVILADVGRAAPRPDIGEDIGAAAVGAMTLAMTGIDAIGQGGVVRSKSDTQVGEFWSVNLCWIRVTIYSEQNADVADQKFSDTRDMEAGVGKAVQTERKKRAAKPCGGGGGGGGRSPPAGGAGGGAGGEGQPGGGDVESVDTNGQQRSQKQKKGRKRSRRQTREYSKTAAAVEENWNRVVREVGDMAGPDESQFTEELSSALQRFVESARRMAARVRELFESASEDGGPHGGGDSDVEQI